MSHYQIRCDGWAHGDVVAWAVRRGECEEFIEHYEDEGCPGPHTILGPTDAPPSSEGRA